MERVRGVLAVVKTKATTTDPLCGCCSLQKAATGWAIFDMVFGGIALIVEIYRIISRPKVVVVEIEIVVVEGTAPPNEFGKKTPENTGGGTMATVSSIIMIILYIAILAMAVLLYLGAKKRDYSKVRLWFIITSVCAVLVVIDALLSLSSFWGFLRFLITILITGWQLWIIYAFMHEIDPDNLAARLEGGGDFQGIPVSSNADEVQFSKNPYEGNQQQPAFAQPDPYGWDN